MCCRPFSVINPANFFLAMIGLLMASAKYRSFSEASKGRELIPPPPACLAPHLCDLTPLVFFPPAGLASVVPVTPSFLHSRFSDAAGFSPHGSGRSSLSPAVPPVLVLTRFSIRPFALRHPSGVGRSILLPGVEIVLRPLCSRTDSFFFAFAPIPAKGETSLSQLLLPFCTRRRPRERIFRTGVGDWSQNRAGISLFSSPFPFFSRGTP